MTHRPVGCLKALKGSPSLLWGLTHDSVVLSAVTMFPTCPPRLVVIYTLCCKGKNGLDFPFLYGGTFVSVVLGTGYHANVLVE